MLDSLADRGPDGRGTKMLAEGRVLLGHRRLSIIDLSNSGAQPMSNEDGTVWLTCNGEIYNYRRLRQELIRLGHAFRSDSDSETIIHAYEEWGVDCIHRFRGIFAFAIYDSRSDKLFLARDHVGVKPLYYYHDEDAFIFASQPKAILQAEGFHAQVDPEAFRLYLAYGNVPAYKCIFQGVKKLLPGHRLIVQDGHVETSCYWTLHYQPLITSREEAERVVAEKVEECVVAQSVSDVPIGTLLSGGVDSTIQTGILVSSGHSMLDTFTIGFEEIESDERKFAQFVANHYRTNHHEALLPYKAATAMLPDIVEAYDEPFHLNGLFPMFALSRLVQRNKRKVVLGGDGGDELFAGYMWYDSFANHFVKANHDQRGLPRLLSTLFRAPEGQKDPLSVFFHYNGFLNKASQSDWMGPVLGPPASDLDVLSPLSQHWHPEYPPVLAAQFLDFHCFLVDHCLSKVDRATMACGVEARVPFLDPELVSLIFSIDHRITFSGGERKALLKRSLRRFLPTGMDTRRKKGFSSPIDAWVRRGFSKLGKSFLLKGSLCARGILNPDTVESTYYDSGAGIQLLLLGAELWIRRWLEGDLKAAANFAASEMQVSPSSENLV
jgi:asparagine synthase (glutamine-hydrolysing)